MPGLAIVAESPRGELAAYALFWLDPINRIGLLEPVGARVAYRRMGLSKAVLQEGLRRLQAYGARNALVSTGAANVPAIALYAAAGFEVLHEELQFRKRL